MKKNYLSLILLLCALNFGFGQTTLWTEDFTLRTYTVTLGAEGNDGTSDYFHSTDGTNINKVYTGNIGDFFAAQDIDDTGWLGSASPSQLTWTGINIAGYTSLEFIGDFASISTNHIDNTDYVLIEYQIDGTGYNDLLAFTNDGTTFNTEFGEDTDFDGVSDGADLNATFSNFIKSIVPTGNVLDLRITMALNAGDEDFAIDNFEVRGISACTPTHTLSSFVPVQGPIGTVVTIIGNDFSNTTSVDFNGVSASNITYLDTDGDGTIDTLLAEVDAGTTSGAITITEAGCPITSAGTFTIIDTSGGCLTSNISDLIITELYDKGSGTLGYIEVFNGTGSAVNLSGYSIRRYGDADDLCAGFFTLYTFPTSTPTINNNQVIFGEVFSPGNTDADTTPNFTFDVDCSNTGGNSFDCLGNPFNIGLNNSCGGFNGDDIFHLYNGTTLIDVFVVPSSNIGYTSLRDTNTAGPNAVSNPGDWTHNTTESITDLGTFIYTGSTISFPSTTNPTDVTGSCIDMASFTSNATASVAGTLTYEWYFNDGINTSWSLVNAINMPLTTVSGETTATLTLTDGLYNYDNYQFYCLVTENGSCSTISNAAQLKLGTATWNGTNWIWNDGTAIDTMPTTNAGVIIDGNYNTAVGGVQTSFEACECTVNTGSALTIENNTYVLVENDLTVDGTIILKTDGSFVQTNDTATVNGDVLTDKTKISVEKETAPLASPLEYTYWSSPVVGELISEGLFEANTNRIFSFNGQNFRDSTQETNNDGAAVLGQDDIDDDANDWQFVNGTTIMSAGVGYASTHSPLGFIGPSQYIYTFEGPFNNGIYNIPIYRNDIELNDNNWNFIGNPYPSAIDADLFLAANASIDQTVGATNGAIFFWSHNTAADGNTNGNENLNYAQSDYAIINGSGQTAGGDGVVPTRYIPSGQGFFVSMDDTVAASVHSGTIMTTNVVFNNSMRVTGSNNQFFRTAQYNKLWINLTSDNGIFNQVLIAYVDGATDGDDGMYYDAHKNLSSDLYSGLYTTMDSAVDKKFAIQGKDPNSLNIDEVIPLGFNTTIEEATIYTISIHTTEGNFMDENDIFIIDYDLNIIHNLKTSNYNFTSNSGEFNNRFEIVFTPEALSVNDNTITANDIIITELNNGEVQITVSEQYAIQHVEILDILGRQVYSLNGNGSTGVYDLSKLSKAAYIAKVTLSNGQVISKKAIKQR